MAIYLVTGANRGIGLELAKQILQGPNNKLVAAARNSEASSLQDLQKEYGDRLLRVTLDLLDFSTIPVPTLLFLDVKKSSSCLQSNNVPIMDKSLRKQNCDYFILLIVS